MRQRGRGIRRCWGVQWLVVLVRAAPRAASVAAAQAVCEVRAVRTPQLQPRATLSQSQPWQRRASRTALRPLPRCSGWRGRERNACRTHTRCSTRPHAHTMRRAPPPTPAQAPLFSHQRTHHNGASPHCAAGWTCSALTPTAARRHCCRKPWPADGCCSSSSSCAAHAAAHGAVQAHAACCALPPAARGRRQRAEQQCACVSEPPGGPRR
jgi:hypothetical protein